MDRLEKRMRRALQWAAYYKRVGDTDGVDMAMQRYHEANAKMAAELDELFAPRIELGGC